MRIDTASEGRLLFLGTLILNILANYGYRLASSVAVGVTTVVKMTITQPQRLRWDSWYTLL